MSLFSNKTRNKTIKSLFTALKSKAGLFYVPLVLVTLFFAVLSIYSSPASVDAKTLKSFRPTVVPINVFPSRVSGIGWSNVSNILSQDLSDDALYQSFDRQNSAYFSFDDTQDFVNISTDDSDQQVTGNTSPVVLDEIDTAVDKTTSGVLDETDSSPEVDFNESIDVPVSQDEISPLPVTEEVPLPADSTPSPQTTETEVNDSPIISFFKRVTTAFRFAVETVDESLATTSEVTTGAVTTVANTEVQQPSDSLTQGEISEIQDFVLEPTAPGVNTSSTEPINGEENLDFSATNTIVTDVAEDMTSTPEDMSPTSSEPANDVNPPNSNVSNNSITLSDFGISTLQSGQFIDNMQLRLSLAGKYQVDDAESLPALSVSYSLGKFKGNAGTIFLDEETSNAINGGYYIIPLPSIKDAALLKDLTVTISFVGDKERLQSLYIESAWLEVNTLIFDKKMLSERVNPDQLFGLEKFKTMELLSDELDFTRDETPQFSFKYISQRNALVAALRNLFGRDLLSFTSIKFLHNGNEPIDVSPDVFITSDGLVTITLSEADKAKLIPGEYTIQVEVDEGGVLVTDELEFQWGLLSINTNQTVYENNDVVKVSMGALSPNGNTLCDANLSLYVTDPNGFISNVPVSQSGLCFGNNVVNVPDYEAQFFTSGFGEYSLYLEEVDEFGNVIAHTDSTFFVQSNQEIFVARSGPTRIFPPSPYTMELSVITKNQSFEGQVIERVPNDFTIVNTSATVKHYNNYTELIWDVTQLPDTVKTFSYEFDAPDISPHLFELGPASLVDTSNVSVIPVSPAVNLQSNSVSSSTPDSLDTSSTSSSTSVSVANIFSTTSTTSTLVAPTLSGGVIFQEHRKWQIASDATGNMILFWDNAGSIPSGWTCLSCGSGTFFQKFVQGGSTYNTTGGATTHTHTATGVVNASSLDATETSTSNDVAPTGHTHTFTPTIGTASNLPVYRQLRVIQYNSAGEPATIPAGAIGVFDVASSSLPSGWTRYAAQDGSYIRGENTPGTTGGSNTHTHTITGTTGAAAGTATRNRNGGTQVSAALIGHTHTVSSNTGSVNNEPPYVTVLLGKLGSDATPPNNLIAMWTDAVPTGWTDVSSGGSDPFNGKFLKPGTTYGTTGGSATHSHSNVTGIVSSGPNSTNNARSGTGGSSGSHTHNVDATSFSTDSNLPPYLTVIFGKRANFNPVYNQLSSRWYVNTDSVTPSDPWPVGAIDLPERAAITATSSPIGDGSVIRLRMNAKVTNVDSTAGSAFKLQYGASTTCSAISVWSDVGSATSSAVWRGYNNATPSDHATLSSHLLASSTINENYEENGYSPSSANTITVSNVGEWDWVLEANDVTPSTTYCFRMVHDTGTAFLTYTSYPKLITSRLPDTPTLSGPFDNEKVASTTPTFTFSGTDPDNDRLEYELMIDDDYYFGSPATTTFSNSYPGDVGWASSTFASGSTTSYTLQPTDALSDGVTYWWKVRARDLLGSNTWSAYSTSTSFTIDTSLEENAWFQTVGYQFERDTLSSLSTTTSHVQLSTLGGGVSTTTESFEGTTNGSANFASTLLWKQASISTDTGDWWGTTGGTPSANTGPSVAADGSFSIYTEASAGQPCTNTVGGTNCTIEADIVDGTLDGIQFNYHMFGANISTLNLDLYNGSSWTNVWTRTGQQSTSLTDWLDSGYIDLSAYKASTTVMRFNMIGNGAGFADDIALDYIRVATSTSAVGTIMSPEVSFSQVPGHNTWGTIRWNVSEPVGTDTLLQVYYSNVSACDTLIPDGALPGNSSGFASSSSPIFAFTLSTTTYNKLCLKATLNQGNGASSPTLDDWTINWIVPDQPPSVPSLAPTPAFDNIKTTSLTPTLGGFVSTDYENQNLEYQIEVDNNSDFSSPIISTNSTNYPGDAGWSASNFAAGATTSYTVQTALTNGETYWWHVRARDPGGTNLWTSYSASRSFTVSNAVSVSEWFQTVNDQFDRYSSRSNATTTLNNLTIENSSVTATLLDNWTTGSTKTISSGSDRMLIVAVIAEDSGTDVNVGSVTYGTQTLTPIASQTIGTGFSNGMWLGYLNDSGIQAASNNSISVTWTGSGTPTPNNGILYSSAVYQNINQSTPVRDYSSNALTTGTNITPASAITVKNGDVAFYISESTTGVVHTPHTGYTEGTEEDTGGSGFTAASAYKSVTADGTEYPTATWSGTGNRLLMTSVSLRPSSAVAVQMSPEIDFDWVTGRSTWGEVFWNAVEPTGSQTKLKVYYSNVAACDTIVPNGALAGNSSGFTTASSSIVISGLSTSTYNRICIQATLDQGTSATAPKLSDWTVTWARKPALTQNAFWWFANNNALAPTDTWPQGSTAFELIENGPIVSTNPTKYGDVIRLRLGARDSAVAATGQSYKLQYAAGTTCSDTSLSWVDVGPIGSSTALWRGYNNAAVSDGATLATAKLSGTDVLETYEEENNSTSIPNAISIGQDAEWDWVLENRALAGTNYCFRMVNSDGSRFSAYSQYAKLVTNQSPTIGAQDTPFDNQKLSDVTPDFDFAGVDPESNDINYQIQIDDNADFSSTVVDVNSVTNSTLFSNVNTPADKAPFNDSATIRYTPTSALTNGVTYWWRVRAVDSNGSAQYGDWTTPTSFTIDTSVTLTTWYQTTEEQFDTDNLVGTDATASDLVSFASGSTTGTTTSTGIDFDDVVTGNSWGTFSFSETGSANDILYHIEYYTGSSWILVPDSALAGNNAGYDTSPIDLIDLDTSIYNEIRIRANFRAGSPTLTDWTITWGERVSVPTHLALFDNEKSATTTPTLRFTTTDPQGDDVQYEISWSTDNTFASGTTTVNSGVDSGFTDLDNGADTSPFASGDEISYTMTTPLTNGVTYWWRARAKDPTGGDSYSFWSEPWSFTIDTAIDTATWFQTTDEQFDTDTLTGLASTGADAVSMVAASVNTYNFSGITNPSATHIARDFEVDVDDPTDPPNNNDIDSLTVLGTSGSTPNLRTAIANYASDAEATTGQYGQIAASDNSRWQITDPGAGDNAIFWTEIHIDENPANINQLDLLLEGYQGGVPGVDKGWFGIWRPGSTTPYWELLEASTQTSDYNYTGTITSNISQYFDGNNNIHLIFFNEDDSDSLFVDYVEAVVTSDATTAGTIVSTPIDFDDGSGPAWGQLLWNDSEPGSSSINYQVEYLNGVGNWVLIPNGDLSGNSSGFSTSPVDLKYLDTTTYNQLRLVGNMLCSGANCPTLNDWTVEWSRGFEISGTAFEYDGTSSTTAGTVGVAVNGVLQTGKTGTISNGAWTISNVTYFPGDVVTVFVNGAADADEAVGVTVYDGTPDITGMRLQKRHLTIGSDDLATVTNANLGLYDTTNDEDLFYDVDGSNVLTICGDVACVDNGLVVLSGNTYSPGASVTTHDVINDGTISATTGTIRVSGSWDENGTRSMTGSTVIFTATSSTETIDTTGKVSGSFSNLTLGETAGTATWNIAGGVTASGTMAVSYGTLARSGQPVTVSGSSLTIGANGYITGLGTTTFNGNVSATLVDNNATDQNIGYVVVDGNIKTLILSGTALVQSMTVGADDTLDSGSGTFTVNSHWINNNTFIPRTGNVIFAATSGSQIIKVGGDAFYNLTFSGAGGSWSFTESTLTVNNNLSINAAGTVTLPTATTTIAGSFLNTAGTFAHNNSIVNFTGSGSKTVTLSGTAFTNSFYNVKFAGVGTYTFSEANATTTNNFRITAGTVVFPTTQLSIGGSLLQTAGTITAANSTTNFFNGGSKNITIISPLANVLVNGAGTFTFTNSNATITGNLVVNNGTLSLPSGTLTLGGSIDNNATINPLTGTVLLNASSLGKTIALGASSLYNLNFNSATGGWSVTESATTTNNSTLTAGTFSLSSSQTLAVGGVFTNTMNSASTTWTGSTLSLYGGTYNVNSKSNQGDSYATVRIGASTHPAWWNSSASSVTVVSGGSLYSQDHASVDGSLYIYGTYNRTSGVEYWSYATDFDGTALGGSSRVANVRFASGASANLTNSTLSVQGGISATSTVANQGSGTYTVNVSNGTTTANYYSFIDLGNTGLSLSGNNKVITLDDGSFTPAVAAGSGLTIASTTIDYNPGLQIFRTRFATTTAISAYSVSQTVGTPTSYWWFRNGTGNLYGEAHDNDTGNPGSIRFDDSALTITVSGRVYSDAGTTPIVGGTCDGSTNVVRIVVEGGATYNGTCSNVDGTYTIPGVVIVGDPTLTIFLNNASGGEKATLVTKTPTANITNANLYANRVIVRHEDVASMTIADMAAYDFSDDTDVRFAAATSTSGNTLTTFAGTELYVWATSTFTPGGSVTLSANASANSYDGSLYLAPASSFVGSGTTTYTIGGSLTQATGATFTPASTTVVMNATTTGKTITTAGAESIAFNNLSFTGSAGGWNLNGAITASGNIAINNGTVTGTNNITLTNGSLSGNGLLSLGGGTVLIAKTNTLGGTQGWTFNNLTLGNGSTVGTTTPASTATTTIAGVFTIANAHFYDAGASNINLTGTGSVFVETGTFLEDTSTVRFSGNGSSVPATAYYNLVLNAAAGTPTYTATGIGIQVLNDLTVGGTAATTFDLNTNDTVLSVTNDVIIKSNGSLSSSNIAAFTVYGSWQNQGAFSSNSGTVTFAGTGTETITPGVSSFASATLSGAGNYTVTNNATATAAFTIKNLSAFTLTSGQTLAVGGAFRNYVGGAATTWTGSTLYLYGSGSQLINPATTTDSYATLHVGTGAHVRTWNSSASTVLTDSNGSLYSMDNANTNGDLYIYGDYANTSTIDHWSYSTDFDGTALGGSSRQVHVYIENGGTVKYTGTAQLSVLGSNSATTTIAHQSSGTFGIQVGSTASTTLRYYDIRDLTTSGLVFSGNAKVNGLSNGVYTVGTTGGSAITVGGTVINANPAKTFSQNVFATSSGVTSAINVTATGTAVSSWRFTNHSGSIEGEAFDNDPGGDPGYIVWDNSSANITISGVVYSDEGATPAGAGVCDGVINAVQIVVAGLTTYNTTCAGGTGIYSISGISYGPSDSIVAYLTSATGVQGAAVTLSPISNINDMDIYVNRVIVRHENTNPITIDDMAVYDSSDDANIPFTAVSGSPDTLTLPADRKLIVWTNKTFAPGGNVTLTNGGSQSYGGSAQLFSGATWTSAGTESHIIGGSFTSDSGATFTPANSTVTFNTSGASRTIDINNGSFNNLTISGTGSWTVTDSILDVNTFSQSNGALTLPTGTTTVSGSWNVTAGSFVSGGPMVFDGTAANTITFGGSNAGPLRFTGSGSWSMNDTNATSTGSLVKTAGSLTLPSGVLTLAGSFDNRAGAVTHNTDLLRISTSSNAFVRASSSDLFAVTFTGGGTYSFADTSLTLLDDLILSSGSLTLASGTLAIGGSFDTAGGTFTHASGTLLFNSTDTGETIDPGTSSFYNVNFGSAGGGWTITGNATTTNNFTLTSGTSFTVQSGKVLNVWGVFTNSIGGSATVWTGSVLRLMSGLSYSVNSKSVSGDQYDSLYIGPNTDVRIWNSSASDLFVNPSGSLYSQDNAAVDGSLYIYGDFHVGTTTEYWSYATDFDGTALGGSSRNVAVSIFANATTTIDGGTLRILGSVGHETIISNQGSGQYTFAVKSGTFNAQYYKFRNLNYSGLSLTGTPNISSLNYGDFELAVNGGSLISVSSTTLNANASLVLTGNRFATTTSISGYNVKLSGTTTSAWTFVSHTGNLDGEAFDIDGATDCGSVRWMDSVCQLTQQTHYRWRNDDGGLGVPNTEWYNASWNKRQRVRFENANSTTTSNAVIKLTVPYDTNMQSDFDDLRFTDDTGTVLTPFWIEKYTASTEATIWVQVPSLTANDYSTVFMYYDNSSATTTSSSTQTFIAADDFEDGNKTEYSGDTSLFSVNASHAYSGSYGLDNTGQESSKANNGIARFNQTVSQGETIHYWQYVNGSNSGDEPCTLFAVQSPVTLSHNYGVCLEQYNGDRVSIVYNASNTDSSGVVLASTTLTYTSGWHEIEIKWALDGSIDVNVLKNGSIVATVSANDTTYTSGGYGFTYWYNYGGWDNFTSRPLLETEPTAYYGAEQTNGGASWKSALDTFAGGYSVGDVARLRILVENSGLQISGQQYQLEYANLGTSPSCESVTGSNYVPVPVAASCGTSPVCMTTTTNYNNGDSTTDLLSSANGTFTSGSATEDPSNTANSLTIDQNQYIELEYAITPTTNVTDENMCFRVSNLGSDLDTYLKVAQLSLQFDPTISAINFNNGVDISLVPGTTTRVYATSTVTDLNGYTDLVLATSTMFTSSSTAACSADDNNCYISTVGSQCSYSACAGNSCTLSCYADFYYFADPTDSDGRDWYAFFEVEDSSGGYGFNTSPAIDVGTLRALDVNHTINYGSIEAGTSTASTNASTTVQNIGNDAIDILIAGTDLSDGYSSTIPVSEQKFATSTFNYDSCTTCGVLATSTTNLEVDLGKPTAPSPAVTDQIFWGIAVPFGISSNAHSGYNTFYATND